MGGWYHAALRRAAGAQWPLARRHVSAATAPALRSKAAASLTIRSGTRQKLKGGGTAAATEPEAESQADEAGEWDAALGAVG